MKKGFIEEYKFNCQMRNLDREKEVKAHNLEQLKKYDLANLYTQNHSSLEEGVICMEQHILNDDCEFGNYVFNFTAPTHVVVLRSPSADGDASVRVLNFPHWRDLTDIPYDARDIFRPRIIANFQTEFIRRNPEFQTKHAFTKIIDDAGLLIFIRK